MVVKHSKKRAPKPEPTNCDWSSSSVETFRNDDKWFATDQHITNYNDMKDISSMSVKDRAELKALLAFSESVKPKKRTSQRPRPKGVPSSHLGIRLARYGTIESRENTPEEIAAFKPPSTCYVCNIKFSSDSSALAMAMHYYEVHRDCVPFHCPFPKVTYSYNFTFTFVNLCIFTYCGRSGIVFLMQFRSKIIFITWLW